MARGHNGDFMLGKRAIWEEGLPQNGQLCPKASAGFRRKLIDALRIKFNSTVRYVGKLYSCYTLIRLKA